jgi:hypothetical protein
MTRIVFIKRYAGHKVGDEISVLPEQAHDLAGLGLVVYENEPEPEIKTFLPEPTKKTAKKAAKK